MPVNPDCGKNLAASDISFKGTTWAEEEFIVLLKADVNTPVCPRIVSK